MLENRQWRWELETRKLLGNDKFAPFTELMTWRDFGQMEFPDHVMAWSRWDYLMSLGKEPFGVLMQKAKSLVDPMTGVMRGDVVEGCREALREAYQLSPLTLDERWKEWVLENYPTR